MNFFHFGAKSEKDISEIQTKYKSKIWHKCSEHKHYNGLPKELPILIGIVSTKGKFSKKNLVLKLYLDKILFFKVNYGIFSFIFKF